MKGINLWPLLLAAIAFAVAIGLAATQSRDGFAVLSFDLEDYVQPDPPPARPSEEGDEIGEPGIRALG